MTSHGERPETSHESTWTAYERANDGRGFDYDGYSCMHAQALGTIRDVEDLTMLAGLESIASESDTA